MNIFNGKKKKQSDKIKVVIQLIEMISQVEV